MQERPQPPPGPTSHARRARTGAPTDRSRSLATGRAVRGSQPGQSVDHRPCLPVFFRWLHFRQPRRQQPHVAAHSSDHRIGSGHSPRDRRPFVGARHPLRPHFARSSSAGHRWSAARDTSWLTLITSSGRHIMRRSARQAPSAASTRPPRRTNASPWTAVTRSNRAIRHRAAWRDRPGQIQLTVINRGRAPRGFSPPRLPVSMIAKDLVPLGALAYISGWLRLPCQRTPGVVAPSPRKMGVRAHNPVPPAVGSDQWCL